MYVNIQQTIFNIVAVFAGLVIGVCAFAFLRAGLLWAANSDNPHNASRARSALEGGVIGALICVSAITLAWLIVGNISYQDEYKQKDNPFITPPAITATPTASKP